MRSANDFDAFEIGSEWEIEVRVDANFWPEWAGVWPIDHKGFADDESLGDFP